MAPQDLQALEMEGRQISPLGNTYYALSRQKLNEIIKTLRECGTEGVIQLPKIAVIGNQSAGKSSIIEAISQIKVPRSSGTCTRCPMEVVLSRSDQVGWRCKVSLRFDHNDVPGSKVGTCIFAETYHKEEVPIILRRAQLAILNPNERIDAFLNLDPRQCKKHPITLSFSKNTIVMEITGADVDVTFIDLPGIISNTEMKEESHFIELIKDMAISYVSQDECLILVAISMKDDIDNQSAAKIARECDPNGVRTIGVLTKADTVQEGDYEQWRKIHNNESHILRRGYYITRLPGPTTAETKQSWKEARDNERRFFRSTPWSQLDKSRLGIEKLTEALSLVLATMIEEKLPILMNDVSLKLRTVQDDIDLLPHSFADNPQAGLLALCSEFITQIDEYTNGTPNHASFFQELHKEFWKLTKEIVGTRSTFETTPTSSTGGQVDAMTTSNSKLPSRSLLTEADHPAKPKRNGKHSLKGKNHFRDIILQNSIRELPGIIPFTVHEHFIKSFVSVWRPICLDSFREVEQLLRNLVRRLCVQHFDRFHSYGLSHEVSTVTSKMLEKAAEETRKQIELYCTMEQRRPFTLNHNDFNGSKQGFSTDFSHRRRQSCNLLASSASSTHALKDEYGNSHSISSEGVGEDALMSLLTAKGYHINSAKQLTRLHDPDECENELTVISQVLAYFEISSKRIVDLMPMIFETVFARQFGDELRRRLTSDLKLVGEFGLENCARYARDEPDVQFKRQEYNKQKEILSKALEIISRFFN